MIEELDGVEGGDFVAPDESKRIGDPAEAEAMARASDVNRSRAVELRQGDNPRDSHLNRRKREKIAFLADSSAEGQEMYAGIEHRVSQMSKSDLEKRHQELITEQSQANNDIRSFGGLEPSRESPREYHEALFKREAIEHELSEVEKKLTGI